MPSRREGIALDTGRTGLALDVFPITPNTAPLVEPADPYTPAELVAELAEVPSTPNVCPETELFDPSTPMPAGLEEKPATPNDCPAPVVSVLIPWMA
ncbi:MAG: hypothetical protein WBQ76_03195 [Candidatus Korobacteraceae bacterium]